MMHEMKNKVVSPTIFFPWEIIFFKFEPKNVPNFYGLVTDLEIIFFFLVLKDVLNSTW